MNLEMLEIVNPPQNLLIYNPGITGLLEIVGFKEFDRIISGHAMSSRKTFMSNSRSPAIWNETSIGPSHQS